MARWGWIFYQHALGERWCAPWTDCVWERSGLTHMIPGWTNAQSEIYLLITLTVCVFFRTTALMKEQFTLWSDHMTTSAWNPNSCSTAVLEYTDSTAGTKYDKRGTVFKWSYLKNLAGSVEIIPTNFPSITSFSLYTGHTEMRLIYLHHLTHSQSIHLNTLMLC